MVLILLLNLKDWRSDMNVIDYNQLITKTFCDNAIRSVMMIDDEFLTYSSSINALYNHETLEPSRIEASRRAAQLESFFQDKKMLCDIDDCIRNVDIDRIRKSDLIIIDYHLEDNDPKKTLSILHSLRDSQHLNMVVVYTREQLDKVWMQVSAMMRGNIDYQQCLMDNEGAYEIWDELISHQVDSSGEYSLEQEELIDYILNGKPTGRILKLLHSDENTRSYKRILAKVICEYSVSKYNLNKNKSNKEPIYGKNSALKWLQSGNVFVTLYQKNTDDGIDDARIIWDELNQSLYEWKPSYYKLIKSEIQNKIEAEALSFNVHLSNDINGQAAWLHEIIKSENIEIRNDKVEYIFNNLSEEFLFRLKGDFELRDYINNVFDVIKSDFDSDKNEESSSLIFCAKTMGLSVGGNNYFNDMYHALNMNISSRNYNEKYISTGSIFLDVHNENWYLCVSAACDMVPSQGNEPYHTRLNPHRMIKVLKLFEVDASKAISNAHHSKYIYAYNDNVRKYFTVYHPQTNMPLIDYMVILNHVDKTKQKLITAVIFSSSGDDIGNIVINLKMKSQLRAGYAERYQSIASQYGGRIGVDYFGLRGED